MTVMDQEERRTRFKKFDNKNAQELREISMNGVKDYKTSWLMLAQALYAIWRDKLYEYWGYEKFEHYVEREAGLKKALAMKLVKTYTFVEDHESELLRDVFTNDRDATALPEMEAINVLRSARSCKEISREDYSQLRKMAIEGAKPAADVRKALTSIIKERTKKDPDQEREERNYKAARKLINALKEFTREAQVCKLLDRSFIDRADELRHSLVGEIE